MRVACIPALLLAACSVGVGDGDSGPELSGGAGTSSPPPPTDESGTSTTSTPEPTSEPPPPQTSESSGADPVAQTGSTDSGGAAESDSTTGLLLDTGDTTTGFADVCPFLDESECELLEDCVWDATDAACGPA